MNAPMTPEQRSAIAHQLGDAKPATDGLLGSLAESVANVRTHDHPKWEDLYCMNLTSYMGERMAPVLRRLLDAEARLADAELPPSGRPAAAEYRLGQYAQPPRTFESATERALFEIAIDLRQVLADTRRRRDDARAGREEAEAEATQLRARVAELEARSAPAAVLRGVADEWSAQCPEHSEADEVWMSCPGEWVYELHLAADAFEAGVRAEPAPVNPWERAVAGLNALVDADVIFHVEPDGHISAPFSDEHIEWDLKARRWVLTHDDEDGAA